MEEYGGVGELDSSFEEFLEHLVESGSTSESDMDGNDRRPISRRQKWKQR
jgi:hypothetical protein